MDKVLGASYKTTLAGIGMILVGVGNAIGEWKGGGFAAVNFTAFLAAITAGIGLIMAKDSNVSNSPAPGPAAPVLPAK
jgi:hypothetical protein